MKKTFTMVLNPSKTSRTITFEVELKSTTRKHFETLQPIETYCLSICGGIRKRGCICQMQDEISTFRNRVKKEDLQLYDFLLNIWYRYHLNNYKAGTKKQEEEIKKYLVSNKYDYDKVCEMLKSKNLYIDNGYRYGTDWLIEPIPQEILNKLFELLQ